MLQYTIKVSNWNVSRSRHVLFLLSILLNKSSKKLHTFQTSTYKFHDPIEWQNWTQMENRGYLKSATGGDKVLYNCYYNS
jgi:hypothetical protein